MGAHVVGQRQGMGGDKVQFLAVSLSHPGDVVFLCVDPVCYRLVRQPKRVAVAGVEPAVGQPAIAILGWVRLLSGVRRCVRGSRSNCQVLG